MVIATLRKSKISLVKKFRTITIYVLPILYLKAHTLRSEKILAIESPLKMMKNYFCFQNN